ncbi:MAG: zinc dependent phospholipase C family protein [Terracidiphilus sp.]
MKRFRKLVLLVFGLLLLWGGDARAYSLLTHEQLIDLTWKDSIVPLLLSRYPNLTPAQLEKARAYAYGGCVIQDIGYYPFGDLNYSNLTHYVRTGDFVINLFRDAQNANELAFAVGALSHYIGDTVGHAEAINLAVPVEFPKLRAKYGPVVNYAEGERQHVQTEFAFDINEIAHHRMAPVHYLRHIGLEVAVKQLALAFYQTYGVGEDFTGTRGRRVNVRAYRFAVREFIPRIAYAVTLLHRGHEPPDPTTPEALEFEKQVTAVASENDWQAYRRKAGIGTYTLAGLLFVIPKFGPLKMVAVKGPTEETEAEYIHSVVMSMAALRQTLARFTPPGSAAPKVAAEAESNGQAKVVTVDPQRSNLAAIPGNAQNAARDLHHPLPNRDLDTGRVVQPGGYSLTDSTYAQLLHKLTRRPTEPIPSGIKEDIQAYYANPEAPITTKKNAQQWAQVQADLSTLQAMPTSPWPEPFPTYDQGTSSVN